MPFLSKFLLRRHDFLSQAEVRRRIETSKHYGRDGTDPDKAHTLLIFSTTKQQTWLVATPKRIYCILDDIPRDEAPVCWSLAREDLVDDRGGLVGHLIRVRDKSKETGLLDIGPRRGWLLTRDLFGEPAKEIADFLASQFSGPARAPASA